MPIQGLVDKSASPARGLPQIGVLHKGAKKQEGSNKMPPDLDYFRVEFKPQFEHLRPVWERLYGKEPKEFTDVLLTAPTADQAFSYWKEEWTATTLVRRCDGVNIVRHWNAQTGKYSDIPQACAKACKCKQVGKLGLILREFVQATGVLGTVTLNTTSVEDIITIQSALTSVQALWGTLASVPFVLGRADKQITAPDPKELGKRIKITKSLVYLHLSPEFARQQMLSTLAGTSALPAPPVVTTANGQQALPAPSDWRDAFCQWCADVFGVACEQVELALANYANGEFNGTKEEAIAAVVLLVANYDLEQAIDLVKSKVPAQRVDAVLQIVTEYMNAVMAEAEFPE